jgi:2-succinyl-6-hydroxy-2,4-cyclohexadiene-1-carboxylate synthase
MSTPARRSAMSAPATAGDGHAWHLRLSGTGPPALLALHGFTGSGRTWEGLAEALGMGVVAPDLPGHGMTPTGGIASVEATADALVAAVETVADLPIDVLGYSMGARVALRLAIEHPDAVRRLVLEAPSAGIADPAERARRRDADEARARLLDEQGIEAFLDAWEREPVLAGDANLAAGVRVHLREVRDEHTAAGLAASLRAAGQGSMEPLHRRVCELTAPSLVIVGGNDPARGRAEAVAAGLRSARIAVVPGAGHAVHLARPDTFAALVRDFLQEEPTR